MVTRTRIVPRQPGHLMTGSSPWNRQDLIARMAPEIKMIMPTTYGRVRGGRRSSNPPFIFVAAKSVTRPKKARKQPPTMSADLCVFRASSS